LTGHPDAGAPPTVLDCRRLLCPLPVIRVQDYLEQLPERSRVEVVCTDPGALNDIPAWCRINGHRVIETFNQSPEIRLIIEK
jgi:tRNA 2-thiouridine synthesizing protein A